MTARFFLTVVAFATALCAAAATTGPVRADAEEPEERAETSGNFLTRAFSRAFGTEDAAGTAGSARAASSADAGVPVPPRHPLSPPARTAVDARREAAVRAIAGDGPPLEAMIGQMLMVGFEGDDLSDPGTRRVLSHIEAGRLGGVILYKRNIRSAAAAKRMIAAFRSASPGPPLLVAIDQEGGRVQRLTGAVGFSDTPSAERVAAHGERAARDLYRRMAEQLADWGFNVNLAPVVDLAVRDDNPIISRIGRAYAADPARVTDLASAFVDAHRSAGVLTALKHFPGHGSSNGDTHHGFVDVSDTWTRQELAPFREMIAAGRADMVMVAHVHHADFAPSGSRAPATLSPQVIDGLLRRDLGFDGVVISDDMEMGAIASLGSPVDVAARAILAGNDILIYAGAAAPGQDLVAVLQDRLKRAALRDPRVAARIRESFARIVRMKEQLRR